MNRPIYEVPADDSNLQRISQLQMWQQEQAGILRRRRFLAANGQGFVQLISVMGCDHTVAAAARLTAQSRGIADSIVNSDRGLLRYLMRHRHTTPMEFGEIMLHVRVPMDTWRQWIRHRTACLAGDTPLVFNRPADGRAYRLSVQQVYEKFQQMSRRERVQHMRLRCVNEQTGELLTTSVVDIWQSGEKPLFEIRVSNGRSIRASADHLFFTPAGWKKLKDLRVGESVTTISDRQGRPAAQFNVVDTETEEWRPILGWEAYYEISDQGRVRRIVGGKGSRSYGRCKQITVASERAVTSLNRPGRQEVVLVHREMLRAFIGEPEPGQEACHRDCNSLNNVLENLYWGTSKENKQDTVAAGLSTFLCSQPLVITEIRPSGVEMTYDLEVAGPWHNFSANDFVVHNSVNEYSTRYSEAIDEAALTMPDKWRMQSQNNRQGSAGELADVWPEGYTMQQRGEKYEVHREVLSSLYDGGRFVRVDMQQGTPITPGQYLSNREQHLLRESRDVYDERLVFGVAKEQARKDLPLSTFTEAWWKIDLNNLFKFLSLRMDSHAQLEIREYANIIGEEIVAKLFPILWEAFLDFDLNSVTFSATEMQALKEFAMGSPKSYPEWLAATTPVEWHTDKPHRERDDYLAKLKKLDMIPADLVWDNTKAPAPTEKVLVVPTWALWDHGYFQGWNEQIYMLKRVLQDHRRVSFQPRSKVETDPSLKQLIPYMILCTDSHVFSYTRGKAQGEARLHAKKSVGIGGHIAQQDAAGKTGWALYMAGAERELAEEVKINCPIIRNPVVGLINDDTTDVGRVHLGVVHLCELDGTDVQANEESMADAGWRTISEVLADLDQYENWSQIAMKSLFG